MAQYFNKVMKLAEQEASSKGWDKDKTNSLISERLQAAVLEEKEYFEKHDKWSYGASAPIEMIGKLIKE